MGEFKRSPSKVWWGNEIFSSSSSNERTSSASPGSQDSGFSDSELHQNSIENRRKSLVENIFKELNRDDKNFSNNFKEKRTPDKQSPLLLRNHKIVSENDLPKHSSEPIMRKNPILTKYSPKVCRSLFARKNYSNELMVTNQYSENDGDYTKHSNGNNNVSSMFNDEHSLKSEESVNINSLPNIELYYDDTSTSSFSNLFINKSAPPILFENHCDDEDDDDDEGVTAFNESYYSDDDYSSSDCEREIEELFNSNSPKHTSTPKTHGGMDVKCINNGNLHRNLFMKLHERKTNLDVIEETDNKAVAEWLAENRAKYDAECMISLQCKSIASEYNEKIYYLADKYTAKFQEMLKHSNHIEHEKSKMCSNSDVENFIGNIMKFLNTYKKDLHDSISRKYKDFHNFDAASYDKVQNQLYAIWSSVHDELCEDSVKKLLHKLEYPASEIDLKSTVTAITTISLRNEKLIENFVQFDAIPMLLIHCEKCEGSSARCFILRTLSTLCCKTAAVKQFEKYSGIQLVSDILLEETRPEPERSEAVTLLAQVTAPWIEDNYSIRGLSEYSKKIIFSLTNFVKTTKCCQNFLLCVAALSNITSMESNTSKYIVKEDTVGQILTKIKFKQNTSIYILEQVATLIANISNSELAQNYLIEIGATNALLHFLQIKHLTDDIVVRLQQKAMIALSRLCGDSRAAKEIVEVGGIKKLVKLCREKDERFNNDAVLVAALASLRKIVEKCGKEVISLQDSRELIEPKLLDSFLAYSNQNESYV